MEHENADVAPQMELSPIQKKLRELAAHVTELNSGQPKERVAVPSPNGGYVMVVREIKS